MTSPVPSPRWSRSNVRAWLAVLCLPLVLAPAACGAKGQEGAKGKIPTPVRVRQVEEQGQLAGARYSGNVDPGTRVDLAFKVGGYVRELAQVKNGATTRKVQEGDWVTKGTVLAVVRESDYEQRVAAANAALSEAIAAQKQAQLDFDRSQKLSAGGAIPKVELDTQGARLDTATARVEGARSRIREAEIALADCTLRAPIDGVVLKRPIEVGSLVAPGALGFVIADTKTVKVMFGAPDRLIEKLKPGGTLKVTFEAVPGDFPATISRIAPSADPKSRVFEVEASIPNPNDQLKVGMIAKLVVPEAALETRALVLPLTAIVRSPRDPRGFSVFVVEGEAGKETARLRDVHLGDVVGNAVVVSEGLKNNEKVVSMGATLLTDGEQVRIIPN
ncbi:MAG: efflux RND transporter periplasmic adaptor subunit [Deltaproteobacteria bacterium]|nr:efflux RND transporter periplasmic adaptor subunit [Deltaproteobacteria bacterium]